MEPPTNSLFRSILVPASAALLALGLGIVVGVRSVPKPESQGSAPIDANLIAELAEQARAFSAPSESPRVNPVQSAESLARADGALGEMGDVSARIDVIRAMNRAEYPRLMGVISSLEVPVVRDGWSELTMTHWLAADPVRAVGWFGGVVADSNVAGAVAAVDTWVREHPDAALASLAQQPPGVLRRSASNALVPRLVQQGSAEMARIMSGLPSVGGGDEIRRDVLRQWATLAPADAFAHASHLASTAAAIEGVTEVFHVWWPIDPQAAAHALASVPDDAVRDNCVRRIVVRVPAEGLRSFSKVLLRAWSVETLAGTRETISARLLASVAGVSPIVAADALGEIIDVIERARIAERVVQMLSTNDILAAGAIALAIPAGAPQQAALRTVGSAMARVDPEGAVRWASAMDVGASRDAALQSVFFAITAVNPRLSAQLVEKLSPGLEKEAVYVSIATAWGFSDPDAVGKWLESCGPSDERDAAAVAFVKRVVSRRMDLAVAWTKLIAAPQRRHEATEAVGYVWLSKDRSRAESWLAASDLPDARRQLLLRAVREESKVGFGL